jgi:protein TonB
MEESVMALPFLIASRLLRTAPEPALIDNRYSYSGGGSHRALAAALSIGIAGIVGTALVLALAVPEMVRVDRGLNVRQIFADPLPPPQDQPPPRHTDTPAIRPTRTLPPADHGIITDIILLPAGTDSMAGRLGGSIDIDSGSGGGHAAVAPADPVLRDARRDQRFLDRFQPPYPPTMERAGEEGFARVRITISAQGRVTAISDLGSSDPLFFEATRRQALRAWRFVPATRDGVPVESTQELTVSFRMPVD